MSSSKPSLFKRPAWAATKPNTSGDDNSIFGQHKVYGDIIAAQRKKHLEREVKQRAKAEALAAKEERETQTPEPAKKKRRLSKDSLPETSDIEGGSSSPPSAKATTPEPARPARQLRSTPKKDVALIKGLENEPKRKQPMPAPAVINLDESDEDAGDPDQPRESLNESINTVVPTSEGLSKTLEDEEEDPFLRQLQREARERALQRQKEKEAEAARMGTPSAAAVSQSPAPEGSPARATPEQTGERSKFLEPNVAILIKTHIPGTKDLIINRHSSQVLQHVKEYWTSRHELEPAFARQVFFTWRGMRLYNSSTMQSLINQLKKERNIPQESDEDPSNGKIQIEAVTQEIQDQQTRAKAELAAATTSNSTQLSTTQDDLDATPKQPAKKEGIVLILKCKDVEDMPLRVRPNTSIGKIMRAFQSQRHIDKSKKCWLVFEGERLEEDMTANEAGFEDGEQVEVHPR